jgi:hypothetical protein
MNTAKQQPKTSKVVPIHTQQSFHYWVFKSINKLKHQGNTSRLLIIGLIIWNIALTVTAIKPILNNPQIPQFDESMNQQIINEESIPINLPIIQPSEMV